VRDFRSGRFAKALTGETPVSLQPGPRLIIHAMPTQAVLGFGQIDPVPHCRGQRHLALIGQANGVAGNLKL